jgi:hypothetical protein
MVEAFVHLLYAVSPEATWALEFLAALIALFAFYVGVALAATLFAKDKGTKELYYRVLRELLKIFRRRRRRRTRKSNSEQSRKHR